LLTATSARPARLSIMVAVRLPFIPRATTRWKERPCKDCRATAVTGDQASSKRRQIQASGDNNDNNDNDDNNDDGISGTGQGRAKKKGRVGDSPKNNAVDPLPSSPGAEADVKIARRNASAYIHEPTPLSADFSDQDIETLKAEHSLAKLVFVPLGLHEHLLQESTISTAHLQRLLYHVCKELLHPQGTIIVSLSVPIYKHHGRIVGHLQQSGLGMVVEDQGLVVEYGSRGGGLTAEGKKKYIGGTLDHYIVAHHNDVNDSGGLTFTCNETVTPQSFPGRLTAGLRDGTSWSSTASGKRTASPLMSDVPHKGSAIGYHDNVVRFAILRWTKPGDTVISMHAESDGVVECGLNLGRKVEAFLSTSGDHAAVTTRMEEAWEGAWRKGIFSGDGDATGIRYISHGTALPDGIPEITTPHRVQAQLVERTKNLPEAASDADAELGVAQSYADNMGWTIKVNPEDELSYLCAKDNIAYKVDTHDIPIWGKVVVYHSTQQALASLNIEDGSTDLEFVRLVVVADNDLLKRMCSKHEIVRSPDAALYLQIAPTCPAYYASCEQEPDKNKSTALHEIPSYLQRTDSREKLINSFVDDQVGVPAPAKVVVVRRINASAKGVAVYVNPGVSVVYDGMHDVSSGQPSPQGSEVGDNSE
ncbi:unnamed protein product, partial [Ectocarpus sp. 4 AP-2014]